MSKEEHLIVKPTDFKPQWGRKQVYEKIVERYLAGNAPLERVVKFLEKSRCPRAIVAKAWQECRRLNSKWSAEYQVSCPQCGRQDALMVRTVTEKWVVDGISEDDTIVLMERTELEHRDAFVRWTLECDTCAHQWTQEEYPIDVSDDHLFANSDYGKDYEDVVQQNDPYGPN